MLTREEHMTSETRQVSTLASWSQTAQGLTQQVFFCFDFIVQLGKQPVLVFVYRFEVCVQLHEDTRSTYQRTVHV